MRQQRTSSSQQCWAQAKPTLTQIRRKDKNSSRIRIYQLDEISLKQDLLFGFEVRDRGQENPEHLQQRVEADLN